MSATNHTPNMSAKRQQIINAAFDLFSANGFFATGVDLIMRTANVSKRTLYKYFPTKNDLILAVLEYYRSDYKERLKKLIGRNDYSPREKILAIFDDAGSWFGNANFHGCLAVNAMAEYSGKDHQIENSCQCFKEWERNMLQELASELGAHQPEQLAFKLFVLLEGMAATAQVNNSAPPVDMSKMASELIDGAIA